MCYDDFPNFMYSAKTVKQKFEIKKATGEDQVYTPS